MTPFQKIAIDNYIKSAKLNNWWDNISGIYVPVWNDAADNSTNWRFPSTTGSFEGGGWTHSGGSVFGDGSGSYFDMGFKPTDFATGDLSLGICSLSVSNSTSNAFLVSSITDSGPGGSVTDVQWLSNNARFRHPDADSIVLSSATGTATLGIFMGNRRGQFTEIIRYNTGGLNQLNSATVAAVGSLSSYNLYVSAANNLGTPSQFSTFKWNFAFVGKSLTEEKRSIFLYDSYNMLSSLHGLAELS